ncbi:MAG: class I SAM-dependent methyltransferase, partial [Pseudomonadota bacterium]
APTLAAELKRRFPDVEVACEPVQDSDFFERTYPAALAIGLMFLFAEAAQKTLIARVAQALKPGGRFLFSAPIEIGDWDDVLTGRRSLSLGRHAYRNALAAAGFEQVESRQDEGGSHYYDAIKAAT